MKYYTFAQAYGSGDYGDCTYNDQGQCVPVAGGSSGGSNGSGETSNGGALANTGIDLLILATLACLIIFVSLLVRFWRRKAPVPVYQEADSTEKYESSHRQRS